jgi:ribonuclease P protein component
VVARRFRLREEGDVRRVRARGRAIAHGPLVVRLLPNTLDPAQNRYAVIAGKRCGKSVQRNRLKRLVREALRGFHPYLQPGYDLVVICRGTVEEMPALAVAQRSLQNILTRAELLPRDHEAPGPGGPISTSWTMPHADDAEEETPAAQKDPTP